MRDFLVGCALLLTVTAVAVAWNGIGGGGGGGGAAGPTGPTGPVSTLDCTSTVGELHACTVHLTASQVNTLHTISPVTLVAAPGSGTVLDPERLRIEHKFGTLPFCVDNVAQVWVTLDPTSVPAVVHASGTITLGGAPPIAQLGHTGTAAGEIDAIGVAASAVGVADLAASWFTPSLTASNALVSAVGNKPLLLNAQADPSACGAINASTVAAGGTGYVVNDTGTINCSSSNSDAVYHVDSIGGGGAVTSYHLIPGPALTGGTVTGGTFYFAALDNPCPTATGGSQPGIGTGFQVNVNSTTPGDGDVYVTVDYRVIALH